MKKIHCLLIVLLGLVSYSCHDWPEVETTYTPILMSRSELEKSVGFVESTTGVQRVGKIYTYGRYLLVSEKYKGVHVFDNSNPARPVKVGFIQVIGALDIAMKGTVLYADNAVDLVAIDISDIKNARVTQRIKDIFPEPTPPDGGAIPAAYRVQNRPDNTIIVGWKKED